MDRVEERRGEKRERGLTSQLPNALFQDRVSLLVAKCLHQVFTADLNSSRVTYRVKS